MFCLTSLILTLCAAASPSTPVAPPAQINPFPRPVIAHQSLVRWTFEAGPAGWVKLHNCTLQADGGRLVAECTGEDPYFHHPLGNLKLSAGHMLLKLRVRTQGSGGGQVYWAVGSPSRYSPDRELNYTATLDSQWHDYELRFDAADPLTALRLDPGGGPGRWEFESIELVREEFHPLSIEEIHAAADHVDFRVQNHESRPVTFTTGAGEQSVGPLATALARCPLKADRPLEPVALEVQSPGLPPLRRALWVAHPDVETDWITLETPEIRLQVARDGSAARVWRGAKLAAMIAPLVHVDHRLPALKMLENGPQAVRFAGDDVQVAMTVAAGEVHFEIHSPVACEGPVVRALGALRQGLLAGLEYLGPGEHSSSTLDIETPEHLRFAPDPLQVTLPLMAFVTDRGSAALTWDDMGLRPTFATPDFFDGTDDHRMALGGKNMTATLRVDGRSLEEAILWAVKRRGLPALPAAPRTPQEQLALCLKALNGPLRTAEGWGHCVEPHWPRHPFAPIASTLWRLSGEVPDLPKLDTGGTHLPNDAIYFITGRAQQWLNWQRAVIAPTLKGQRPDGSFRYDGPFARGHFEDTASGICARPATTLLEFAWQTGDDRARMAGLKALDFMEHFDVPRGAQTWEVPLHTPDQLASAYGVWACVRGYELSGQQRYLDQARRWAISGLPFVYLWGRYPVMLYGTPPVFGATNWKAPNWIGLPVQWVGGVYAYALTMLARHDSALDWNHLARGILVAAEQMQFPDGPNAGLLPDSFALATQERRPWLINPCALVSLQLVLEGQLDALAVAANAQHRVVAPVPVVLHDGQAHLSGRPGLKYQVLIDGARIVDVDSQGADVLDLGAKRPAP